MTTRMPRALLVALALLGTAPSMVAAQSNPCSLLSDAEATKHIARGQPTYGETPTVTQVAGGQLCEYGYGGQVGVWTTRADLDRFLKAWKADKTPRQAVSGVGDAAWIMFPVPEDKYKDRAAYLAAQVGQRVVTVALFARQGRSEGIMGEVCRGNQKQLKPDERKECPAILADKGETQQSLQPAVEELAKLLVPRVRAGR